MIRHPEVLESDVRSAWRNALIVIERSGQDLPDTILVAIGADENNRLIEMVGSVKEDGVVLIYHAMTPPSKKTLEEVGIER